ncbi:voltage-dependent calcium channel subunit alpha-2/delta-1-like [Styela clava]
MSFVGYTCFLWVVFFSYSATQEAGHNIERQLRIKVFAGEVSHILVNKLLGEFTGISYLEEKYSNLNLASVDLDSKQLVSEKVEILQKIFKDREDLIKRIAQEAETLRSGANTSSLTAGNVTFYSTPSSESNETDAEIPTESEMGPNIIYRNAKCDCGHQIPSDVEEDSVECVQSPSGYKLNKQFGKMPVAFDMSSVHIPTEIFNEDPDVLSDIYMSDGIDSIMQREVCVNNFYSHLTRWVYYATHTGVMRFFPDRVWSDDCETPDIFDSRISPWFLQSVSSPKDVIILIDNSGSVEGLTLNLFKRLVRDFLDTLTTNDFVNVVLYNEEYKFINEKCTGLLQATPRNKQLLQNWVETISIHNKSNIERGFNVALKTLELTTHVDVYSAKCNPMVMFFTDGDAIYPSEAMRAWNSNENKRIFSFTVGKHFYGTETTKEIACKNRGNYYIVPSYTATKSNVQNYLVKISEVVSAEEKKVRWSLPYGDKLGLGFILSGSTPVHDENKLIGVVGMDVVLKDLKDAITDPNMGHDYYPFAIDNNGFAIMHPNLIEENHDDVMSVDFADLEHPNIAKIRQDIINDLSSTGTSSLIKPFVLGRKYLITSSYRYEYASISGTVFKFGLGIHSSKLKYLDTTDAISTSYPDLTLEKLMADQSSDTTTLLYSTPCAKKEAVSFNPCELKENSTDATDADLNFNEGVPIESLSKISCNMSSQIYSGLLLHSYVSDDMASNSWDSNSSIKYGDGVLALYTALETPSFIRTKYLNFTDQTDGDIESLSDDRIKKEIQAVLSNPRDSMYLRHAIHKPQWTIYTFVDAPAIESSETIEPTTPNNTETTTTTQYQTTTSPYESTTTSDSTTNTPPTASTPKRGYIVASKVVRVSGDEPTISPVVTGVVLHPDTFQKNMFSLAYRCNNTVNCSTEGMDMLCNDTENTECLILDDGGFLIASNQEKYYDDVSKFFGLVDGEFMRSLVNKKIYDVYHMYDYQAVCERPINDNSAGIPRCFVPTITDLLSFGWWLSSCARMFFYTLAQSAVFGIHSLFEFGHSHSSAPTGSIIPTKREHCVEKTPILHFGPNSPMLFGQFDCTYFCERSFTSIYIENTNLLFIVRDTEAICQEDCSIVKPYYNTPIDVTIDETCANDTIRYRKPPDDKCYDVRSYGSKDKDSPCSSASIELPYFYVILSFALLHPVLSHFFT